MIEADSEIKFYTREEIDTGKWDDCIRKAGNGLIYALPFTWISWLKTGVH